MEFECSLPRVVPQPLMILIVVFHSQFFEYLNKIAVVFQLQKKVEVVFLMIPGVVVLEELPLISLFTNYNTNPGRTG